MVAGEYLAVEVVVAVHLHQLGRRVAHHHVAAHCLAVRFIAVLNVLDIVKLVVGEGAVVDGLERGRGLLQLLLVVHVDHAHHLLLLLEGYVEVKLVEVGFDLGGLTDLRLLHVIVHVVELGGVVLVVVELVEAVVVRLRVVPQLLRALVRGLLEVELGVEGALLHVDVLLHVLLAAGFLVLVGVREHGLQVAEVVALDAALAGLAARHLVALAAAGLALLAVLEGVEADDVVEVVALQLLELHPLLLLLELGENSVFGHLEDLVGGLPRLQGQLLLLPQLLEGAVLDLLEVGGHGSDADVAALGGEDALGDGALGLRRYLRAPHLLALGAPLLLLVLVRQDRQEVLAVGDGAGGVHGLVPLPVGVHRPPR
mmetsp:Transcript_9934/g.16696  ORF Transcript_9934/g.16696 Transcript_9934/m.16696 type:complete len:370 (-) Transcript_9934:74-1183(-)